LFHVKPMFVRFSRQRYRRYGVFHVNHESRTGQSPRCFT